MKQRRFAHRMATTPAAVVPPAYRLHRVSACIDPFWFRQVSGRSFEVTVAPDRSVTIESEARRFVDEALLDDLDAGRRSRHAGDCLCTHAAGSNGTRWSTPEISAYDGEGRRFAPKITCKRCLELAARWTTP